MRLASCRGWVASRGCERDPPVLLFLLLVLRLFPVGCNATARRCCLRTGATPSQRRCSSAVFQRGRISSAESHVLRETAGCNAWRLGHRSSSETNTAQQHSASRQPPAQHADVRRRLRLRAARHRRVDLARVGEAVDADQRAVGELDRAARASGRAVVSANLLATGAGQRGAAALTCRSRTRSRPPTPSRPIVRWGASDRPAR